MKDLIQQRFKKSLKTYDSCAVVQKQMAKNLISYIPDKIYENILELGCGTGFVTRILSEREYKVYDALDLVEDCEFYIKSISEKINFINSDIEAFVADKKYDLIISNASLQWLDNFEEFVKKLKSNLSSDGVVGITMFGKSNFKELSEIVEHPLKYYSTDEIREVFEEFDIIKLEEDIQTLDFETPLDVLHHIKNTGVNALKNEHWTKKDLIKFEKSYKKCCGENIKLTYNPIYIICKNKHVYKGLM